MATCRTPSANNCGPFICENVQWPHVERHQQTTVALSFVKMCNGRMQNTISKRLWQYHVQHCAVATHRMPLAKSQEEGLPGAGASVGTAVHLYLMPTKALTRRQHSKALPSFPVSFSPDQFYLNYHAAQAQFAAAS